MPPPSTLHVGTQGRLTGTLLPPSMQAPKGSSRGPLQPSMGAPKGGSWGPLQPSMQAPKGGSQGPLQPSMRAPKGGSQGPLHPPCRHPREAHGVPSLHPPCGHPREHFKMETISCFLCSKLDLSLGFHEINISKLLSRRADLLGPPPAWPPPLWSSPLTPSLLPQLPSQPQPLLPLLREKGMLIHPLPFPRSPLRPFPSVPTPVTLCCSLGPLSSAASPRTMAVGFLVCSSPGGADHGRSVTRALLARGWQSLWPTGCESELPTAPCLGPINPLTTGLLQQI